MRVVAHFSGLHAVGLGVVLGVGCVPERRWVLARTAGRVQGWKSFVCHNLIPGVLFHKQRLPVIHRKSCLFSRLEWYHDFHETTTSAFRPWITENAVCDSFHSTTRPLASHAPAPALPSHASVQSPEPETRIRTPSMPPIHRVLKSQSWHVALEFCTHSLDRWRPGDNQDSPQWPVSPRKAFLRAG